MENGEEADFGAEMLRIGGDEAQRFGSGMEENAVDGPLVLQGDGGNLFRHCKNNVKIRDVEKLRLAIVDPFGPRQRLAFWTVTIAAGVIRVAKMTALIAPLDMTAESGRAAPFDRCHDASLCGREPCAEFLTIRFAVAAKDVRHFQLRALHRARALEVLRRRQPLFREGRM